MNKYSKIADHAPKGMKYKVGDTICFRGDERMTSQHLLIVDTIIEVHPFYEQNWYICIDKYDRIRSGLQSVIEEGYVLVNG